MKQRINIVCSSQFGYLIDTYEYCRHLNEDYQVRYICLDEGRERIVACNVEVEYISISKNGPIKWLQFAKRVGEISMEGEFVLVKYFRFCSLLRVYLKGCKSLVMDVRTGSINLSILSRFIFNRMLTFETRFFDGVSIISDSLAHLLKIKKYTVIPLGSPSITTLQKSFDTLRLLYVGTLSNRRIEDTVFGLSKYLNSGGSDEGLSYDIIGDGYFGEVEELKLLVSDLGLDEVVKIHGRIAHNELGPYFDRSNVGVSYIPMTSYYDVQPVTKTLEYIANGMAVIGTRTKEQQLVLNRSNSVSCNDSPESFATALADFAKNLTTFESDIIRGSVEFLSWQAVVRKLDNEVIQKMYVNGDRCA